MKFKVFKLNTLFDFPAISSGMTEDFARKNHGPIPVYGGKKTETPISMIQDDLEGIKYFENCLGWNREGSIGYVFYHNHKFTTNDHHRPMILKPEFESLIDLEYCQIAIQNAIQNMGLTWGKTASKDKVSKLEILIPTDDEDIPNIAYQKAYAKRLNRIISTENKLKEFYKKIDNSIITLEHNCNYENVKLSDEEKFSLTIGKRVLKKDVLESGVPLYSANVNKSFGFVEESNLNDFSKPSLLWGIDGNFYWNYIPENIEFATTDHCGRLQILDENISPEYVFFKLNEKAPNEGFSRTYRASIKRMQESISIDIPINENGEFDLDKQLVIVQEYKKINNLKNAVKIKLENIVSSTINFN